ncbi:MAG: S-layer homology domain-containing protein [Candidatus Pristimantibacillus sp.]
MRKLSVILIAALVIGLFPPSGLTNYVHADTLPPFEAEADLMYEDINGSSQSVTSDSLGSGTFYTGREVFAGDTYISRSAFRFKLPDTVDIPGTPTKYELKFHIIQKNPIDPLFYLDIWGSANNDMSDAVDDAPFTFPTWDTSTPTVRKTNNEIPTSGDITFDVTALVKHFTDATDRDITFVMKGNESVFSNIILNTREEPLTHPQLIVTYSPNYTPTGSISINNGDPYTNSTNVGLNLTGVDQDSDPIEMQFSNDNIAWSSYETYASTVSSWDLSNGDGVKTVYYRLKDDSDAVSTTYSDTIILDSIAPTIPNVDNGGLYNIDKTITFNEGTGSLNGKPFTTGSIVSTEGIHTLVVTDAAGNSTSVTFTIDKTAPAVTGVDNGASYNSDRTVTFDDGTATLNTAPFSSGTTITAEGVYSLVVTDAALNVTTVIFIIDKTNPVITGVDDGATYNTTKTISFNDGTGLLNGNPFLSGSTVNLDGTHTLVVTDAAGNSTSVTFTIDKTAPAVIGVDNGASYNSDRTVTFDDGTATLNTAPFTSGTTITAEDDYTLVVTDDASNVTTIAFTIDKTNPVITGVTDGDSYNSDPTITFDEGTGVLDGSPFTSGTSVSMAGSHTLVVTDAAGNSTSVSFSIDKTAPVVTGVVDGTSYNSNRTVAFDEGTATLNTDPFTSGMTIISEGDYTLVVTDDASNVTTIAFTIDKTNPVITGVTDGDSYNNDPTITFDEGTGMLDGSPFTSGTSVSAAGPHTLVVTDAAGNSTSVTFTIDKTAPVVTGVTDGTSYNSDLTVTFDEGTAMLNTAPFSSGTTITAEGDYTLVVTDDASNVTTLAFTIDKTNPVITGVIDGDSYNSDLTITFDEGTGMLDGSPFTSGSSVSMAGSHTLIVTDAAGNSTSVTFSIDKTAPVVTGVNDGTSYNSDRTVTFDEGTATLNTAPFTSGTTITAEGDYILVVTDDASNVTTLAFTIDKTNPIITGVIDGESYTTSKLVTFNEGTAALNGSAFTSGTTIQTSGTYTLIVTDAAGNHTTAAFIIKLPIPDSGSSGGGIVITNPEEKVTLIINEKAIPSNQLIKATAQVINNKKTTTITFDQEKLKDILNKEQSKSSITVKADNSSSTVAAALNGALLEYLASKDAVIKLQTDSASYTLPIQRINIDNLVKQLSAKSGTTIALKDINVNIEMTTIPKDEVNMNQSQLGQISLVSPAVEFNLTATYGSHTIEINHFNDFVQRTITIPTSTDSQKITGVIITKEGKLSPVPTKVTKGEDGKQHGVINSLSNSVYALISYDKTFSDITNHWAKTSIEDMASRLIVQGNTEQQFLPNTQITRAEFTTIVVRALGLSAVDQPVEFTDVQPSDWFYDTVAAGVNSGLIKGYEDGSFKPEQNLTREEAMVIIFRALERSGMDISISETKVNEILQAFNDNDQFNAWSRTAAAINIQYNIINGVDGSALPDKNITRAETAAIVQRFLQQAKLI